MSECPKNDAGHEPMHKLKSERNDGTQVAGRLLYFVEEK